MRSLQIRPLVRLYLKNRTHKAQKLWGISLSIGIENKQDFSDHDFEMIVVVVELGLVKSDQFY